MNPRPLQSEASVAARDAREAQRAALLERARGTAQQEASENWALWRKNIGEAKWLLLALVLLLFSFCWVRTWIVSLLEADRFAAVIEPLWDKWSQFSPVTLSHLLSYPGRLSMTYVEPIVTFGMAVWAISRGTDAVSGELGRGSLEMLLAQPVSRVQVLWTQATVTIGGAAVLTVACWCGNWVGIQATTVTETRQPLLMRVPGLQIDIPNPFLPPIQEQVPMRDKVNALDLIPAAFNLFCLGFCLAGIATFASSYDRYRWRSIGVVSAVFVIQFIIKGFALSTESLLWLKRFTFFTAFEPQAFVEIAIKRPDETWAFWLSEPTQAFETMGPMGNNAILLGIGFICYALATVVFAKRDLPAPL